MTKQVPALIQIFFYLEAVQAELETWNSSTCLDYRAQPLSCYSAQDLSPAVEFCLSLCCIPQDCFSAKASEKLLCNLGVLLAHLQQAPEISPCCGLLQSECAPFAPAVIEEEFIWRSGEQQITLQAFSVANLILSLTAQSRRVPIYSTVLCWFLLHLNVHLQHLSASQLEWRTLPQCLVWTEWALVLRMELKWFCSDSL